MEVRSDVLEISFQLIEFSFAKVMRGENPCAIGLFYEVERQKKYFTDNCGPIFRFNQHLVYNLASLSNIIKKDISGLSFVIDFDIINNNCTIAEQIEFDRIILEIMRGYKERKLNIVILKRIQHPYQAALFQKCDLLLKM